MSNNTKYVRKFIILKKEYSNMKNLNPKGHGKMELRGSRLMLSLNIENGEKDNYYNVILLSGLKDYELGKIYLENTTKGKGEFKINYKDFEALGFSIDKINAILILRDEKILLGNYINKEDGSIERYINENIRVKEDKEAEEIEKVEELGELEVKELELEELEVEEDPPQEDPIQEEITEIQYKEAITNIFEDGNLEEEANNENIIDKIDNWDGNDQTTNYILNILSFFPYIEPFKMDLKGYNWWKIDTDNPLEEKGFLPYFSYIIGGNQKYPIVRNAIGANQLMEIYKHYIFGLYNEENRVKFYVYGIPGLFTAGEHPSRGTTGFNTWFESKEGRGYWLLYIQPSTGRIIYPLNPMIPKE